MLKRFVALSCTLLTGAAVFISSTGCEGEKKPPEKKAETVTPAAPDSPAPTPEEKK